MIHDRIFTFKSLLAIGMLVGGFFVFINFANVRAATFDAPKQAFPLGNPDLPTTSTLSEVLKQSAAVANGKADASDYSGDILLGGVTKPIKLQLSGGSPTDFVSILELGTNNNTWRFQMTNDYGLYLRPVDHPKDKNPDFHITNQSNTPFVTFSPDVGRVGIGTTDPGAELEVVGKTGSATTALKVTSDGNADDKVFHFIGNSTLEPYQMVMMQTGNVGIGYTNPGTAKLAVNGSLGIGTAGPDRSLTIANTTGSNYLNVKDGTREVLLGVDSNGAILSAMTDTDLIFRAGTNSEKMRILKDGKVGIGTDSPGSDLQIGKYNDTTETLTLATAQNGTSRINFYDNNSTEGASIRVVGETNGSKMTFANRWNTDTDHVTFDLTNGRVGIGDTAPQAKLSVKGAAQLSPNGYKYYSIGTREFAGTPPNTMYTACSCPWGACPINGSFETTHSSSSGYMYCYATRIAGAKYEFYELGANQRTDGLLYAENVKAYSHMDIGLSNHELGVTYGIQDAALQIAKPIFSRIGMVGRKPGSGNAVNDVRFIVDARADAEIGGEDRAQLGAMSNHPLSFITNDIERMRLDQNGGLVINQSNAADPAPLTLYHPTLSYMQSLATKGDANDDNNVRMYVGSRNDNAGAFGEIKVATNHDLKISTKGLERMRIRNNGNVAIGNGAPNWPQLYVEGDVNIKKDLWIDGAGSWGDDSLVVNNSIRIRSHNKDMITALNFDRIDEDGRTHNWKWWHMKGGAGGYNKNALELWEYKTDDSDRNACNGGNTLKGAVCEAKLVILEGGNMGIGGVPDEKNKLQVAGKLDVRGMASVGTTQMNYEPKPIPNKNEGDWNYTLLLNASDTSSIGFHDSGHTVGSIRYKERLFTIGADDGWGAADVAIGGSKVDGYRLTVQGGGVIVGGTQNAELRARHVNGKNPSSSELDNLYLSWDIGKDTIIGGGSNGGKAAIGFNDSNFPSDFSQYRLAVNGGIVANGGDINVKTSSSGNRVALGPERVGFDVAELFETEGEVEVGDVLVVGNKERKLKKSSKSYEPTIVGVVSGSPAILFEGSELKIGTKEDRFTKGTKAPVALTGRVPVKVSLENGAVQPGDYLTTSNKPGIAMKATSAGSTIGIALESYTGGDKKVLVFLKEGNTSHLEQKVENLAKELEALKKKIK